MRVLHIAGGFAQHALYEQLIQHLHDLGLIQTVFAPVRSTVEELYQPADNTPSLSYKFRNILTPKHRVFFRRKIQTIYSELLKAVDPSQFDLIHAHTAYSDGAVAHQLRKQFGIPYLIAVRNTDLNVFMRLRPDLRGRLYAVLRGASGIVFLSPAYRSEFLSRLSHDLRGIVENKSVILGNGIDAFWLEQHRETRIDSKDTTRLLYVGNFSRNKNVENILEATRILAKRIPLHLTLVGGGGKREYRIRKKVHGGRYPYACFVGRVDNRCELRAIYRNHDIFVMPSFTETFGVVYLEALSQGLPIVHSQGQGVDGYFPPDTVSEAADPHDVNSIAACIQSLATRLKRVRPICVREAKKFSWDIIASQYNEFYRLSARK
jgi:glycosyltransferase involved in cell wall biosynthesis